jgi:hypothetical protein
MAGKRRQLSAIHIDVVANAVCPPYRSIQTEDRYSHGFGSSGAIGRRSFV